MAEAKWIRFIYSQDQIKEILDYCEEEKKEAYRHGFNDGQAEGMPLELSTDDAIPFSDWLSIHDTTIRKLEREKMLDDLCNLFRWTNKEGNFRPWNIGHIEQVIRKYRESLRSER